ncbi:DinB family protein [Microlunatus soli]|uniref:DinB superfamily protein n=1 Tax=Microlunatus soli TaxID=630515 RepID=A0A1H1US15_9ACTN|nr:DinB family protein [Microlunatus soli]SDS75378.1 DinB superfamily protein [Microlunatus soli]
MGYPNEDVAELFEQTSRRLVDRMTGLTDDEWRWQPISDDEKLTIRWRLDHIAEAVGGRRNWEWLGAEPSDALELSPADSAAAAVATAERVVDEFVRLIRRPDIDLDQPIGPIAGQYGDAARRGLVLHTLDELIHHAAETALIRDLYAAR